MRRVAVAALSVVALLGLGAGPVHADEQTTSGVWAGSTLVPNPRPCDIDDICGQFMREGSQVFGPRSIRITFGLEAVVTSVGCVTPAAPGPIGPSPSPVGFNLPLTFECNGTYRAIAFATANIEGGNHTLDRTFPVANPAPEVDAPDATAGAAARTVEVSWNPLANPPKDFRGYTVARTTADGVTEAIATVPPTETSWIDATPPDEGGELTYGVHTRRAGANPTDPTDEVTSSGASADPVEVDPAPVDPTDPTVPGDPTDPTDPSDPNDPGGPSAPGGPSNPPSSGGRPTTVVRVPRVGSPSRSFFPPLLSPPDTFNPELPFDEPEPGEEAAVLPDDLSTPFAERAGRGLVIPAAVGLVLAVWAFHLRYLARMARPQYVEAGDDLPEILQL